MNCEAGQVYPEFDSDLRNIKPLQERHLQSNNLPITKWLNCQIVSVVQDLLWFVRGCKNVDCHPVLRSERRYDSVIICMKEKVPSDDVNINRPVVANRNHRPMLPTVVSVERFD